MREPSVTIWKNSVEDFFKKGLLRFFLTFSYENSAIYELFWVFRALISIDREWNNSKLFMFLDSYYLFLKTLYSRLIRHNEILTSCSDGMTWLHGLWTMTPTCIISMINYKIFTIRWSCTGIANVLLVSITIDPKVIFTFYWFSLPPIITMSK